MPADEGTVANQSLFEELKKSRSGSVGYFKTFKNNLPTYLQSADVSELEARLGSLSEARSKWELCCEKLLAFLSEAQMTDFYCQNQDVDCLVRYCINKIEERMRSLGASNVVNPVSSVGATSGTSARDAASHVLSELAARKGIPFVGEKFTGSFLKYQSWWDRFEAKCLKSDAPMVDKFDYLIKSVGGDVLKCIENFGTSSANFHLAVDAIKNRFGRKIPRIIAHVNQILQLPEGGRKKDITSLRLMIDTMQSNIRCLEAMGVLTPDSDDVSAILGSIVISRLPPQFSTRWYEQNETDEIKIKDLLEFAEKKILAMELSQTMNPVESKAPVGIPHPAAKHPRRDTRPAAVNFTQSSEETRRGPSSIPLCPFDSGNHHPRKCEGWKNLTTDQIKNAIRNSGRCFRCFSLGHRSSDCRSKMSCAICRGRHAEQVCSKRSGATNRQEEVADQEVQNSYCSFNKTKVGILLQTAKAVAEGPSKSKEIRMLIDSGSESTFIKDSVARELGLPIIKQEKLIINVFGGDRKSESVNVYRVHLRSLSSPYHTVELIALGTKQISSKVPKSLTMDAAIQYQHLRNLHFADVNVRCDEEKAISLLVGVDQFDKVFTSRGQRIGFPGEPIATNTVFGWVLTGSAISQRTESPELIVKHVVCEESEAGTWDLDSACKEFLKVESYGVTEDNQASLKDDEAVQMFHQSVEHNGERYVVRLPWRPGHPEISSNFNAAYRRLKSLLKRLSQDEELNRMYRDAMKTMELMNFIEDIPSKPDGNFVFYLPHHPVIKRTSKTTKCRPVFAGNAMDPKGVSLNDCLLTGPSLLPDIPELVMRFRIDKVVITSDIVKAFLQLSLDPCDRDVCRFLWVTDQNEVRIMRFKVITFGISSAPFLLNMTILFHLSNQDSSPLMSEMKRNFYVDNLSLGSEQGVDLVNKSVEAFRVMKLAGMTLSQWASNSSFVLNQLEEKGLIVDRDPLQKLLGLQWNTKDDTLNCCLPDIPDNTVNLTKRNLLSLIAKVFDPCGFLAPIIITGKLIMQRIWLENLGWDTVINRPEIVRDAEIFIENLKLLNQIVIPRLISSGNGAKCLAVFCDSSEQASVANVYLVEGDQSNLLISKSKVTPKSQLKKSSDAMTIPKLELVACVMASTLATKVLNALNIDPSRCYFFTDSAICLFWIAGMGKQKNGKFVKNRISKISELTDVNHWKHVESKENPSDLATRPGCSVEKLNSSQLWWHGPGWLIEQNWPSNHVNSEEIEETLSAMICNPIFEETFEQLVDLERFSSLNRVQKTAAFVCRFLKLKDNSENRIVGHPTPAEMEQGLLLLIRQEQQISFASEYQHLSKGEPIPQTSSLLKLRPRWDPERRIIVSVGRENPEPLILLPRRSRLSFLIAMDCHHQTFHSGPELVLAQIRERFWIIAGRTVVKEAIGRCIICKFLRVNHYPQIEASLPLPRVQPTKPFSIVGLDFIGPVYTKGIRTAAAEKAYVVLFTCAVTRAIHLELVPTMSVADFSLAFRKFEARRGKVKMVYSDNAKAFVKFKSLRADIDWRLIPDRTPWWGGFYERLVRNVKQCLRPALGRSLVEYAELEAILIEVEGVVNSRPLIQVSDNIDDPTVITPNSFLRPSFPGNAESGASSSKDNIVHLYRQRQKILKDFWSRWSRTYLKNLHPWRSDESNSSGEQPHVGDLVLVEHEGRSRFQWPFARVESLIQGRDGVNRAAYVRLGNGRVLRRPTKKLYSFEAFEPMPTLIRESASVESDQETSHHEPEPSLRELPNPGSSRYGRVCRKPSHLKDFI